MSAIRNRLTLFSGNLPKVVNEENKWIFTDALDDRLLRQFLAQYQSLDLEYRAHCAKLARDLLSGEQEKIKEGLEDALILADLLERIYRDYLNVPREAKRFLKDKQFYRQILSAQIKFQDDAPKKKDWGVSSSIRNITSDFNPLRLLSIRIRRVLLLITPLVHETSAYRQWFKEMDRFAGPVLSYFAWMFFVPRLANNLIMTAKHLIPGPWMGREEYDLGLAYRFWLQLQRRWFELGNDTAWLSANMINCFVMVGALAPYALYVSLALQAFDVIFACLRAAVDINRMHKLQKQYEALYNQEHLLENEKKDIRAHQKFLKERMAFEYKRHCLRISNTVIIFLALSLALPFIAVHPVIPLIGAIITVVTALALLAAEQALEQKKPVDSVTHIQVESSLQFGLFRPQPPVNQENEHRADHHSSFENV